MLLVAFSGEKEPKAEQQENVANFHNEFIKYETLFLGSLFCVLLLHPEPEVKRSEVEMEIVKCWNAFRILRNCVSLFALLSGLSARV
jgi:hypothetical protein